MFLHPEKIIDACHLQVTDTVADFGAGYGHFSRAAAQHVRSGQVFAIEVQRGMVETLAKEVSSWHIKNIYPLWGDIEVLGGSTLKDVSVDFVILSNILFQLSDPAGCISEIRRVLKKGGRVLVVDWSESYGGMGPAAHHVFTKEKAKKIFEAGGFTILREDLPAGEHHYGILFKY